MIKTNDRAADGEADDGQQIEAVQNVLGLDVQGAMVLRRFAGYERRTR